MSKQVSKKEHRKHVHHVLLYLSLITAAIVTVIVSVFTLTKVTVNSCNPNEPFPNDSSSVGCAVERETAYGWPFQQIDNEPLWPTLGNFAVYLVLVFGLVKTEAHLKGHIHHGPKKK